MSAWGMGAGGATGGAWGMGRRKPLSKAQRQVINNDDVAWCGWDARGRPVVGAYYYAGFLQPQSAARRNAEAKWREWAVQRDGMPTDVKEPVERVVG